MLISLRFFWGGIQKRGVKIRFSLEPRTIFCAQFINEYFSWWNFDFNSILYWFYFFFFWWVSKIKSNWMHLKRHFNDELGNHNSMVIGIKSDYTDYWIYSQLIRKTNDLIGWNNIYSGLRNFYRLKKYFYLHSN